MYGYNEKAERQTLTDAVKVFFQHLQKGSTAADPVELLDAAVAALLTEDRKAQRKAFHAFLTGQRENLLFDDRVWKQRPFDLLAHEADLGTDEKKQEAIRCLQGWELLAMAMDAAGHAETADGEEWLQKLRKSLRHYEKTILPLRRSLDVFDHQISYEERLARYQEQTLPAVETIILPIHLCKELMLVDSSCWKDIILWYAMAYRHFKNRGIDSQMLARKDFYAMPSAYSLSLYRVQEVTPQTFHNRISKKMPTLLSCNGVPMVRLSAAVYAAFEKAEAAYAADSAKEDTSKEKIYLWIKDDGTRQTIRALGKALDGLAAEMEGIQPLLPLFHQTKGRQEDWQAIAASGAYAHWKTAFTQYLSRRSTEKENLLLYGSYKNAEPHALNLLLGYLLYDPEKESDTYSRTADAENLWTALTETIAADPTGDRYMAYRAFLAQNAMRTVLTCGETALTITMEQKPAQTLELDDAQQAVLHKVLTEDRSPTFNKEDRAGLADLYSAAVRWVEIKQAKEIKMKLSAALTRGSDATKNLETFLLLALQCSKAETLHPQLFAEEKDVEDFLAFLKEVRQGRVHQALRLVKQEKKGVYFAEYAKVHPEKFSPEEDAVFRSMGIETKNKKAESAAHYTSHTLNGLLRKALPYALPKTFEAADPLKARSTGNRSKEDLLGTFLLSVSLFRLYAAEKKPTFFGRILFEEDYIFDEEKLADYKAFLPRLLQQTGTAKYDARKTFDGEKYTVEITKAVKKKR